MNGKTKKFKACLVRWRLNVITVLFTIWANVYFIGMIPLNKTNKCNNIGFSITILVKWFEFMNSMYKKRAASFETTL